MEDRSHSVARRAPHGADTVAGRAPPDGRSVAFSGLATNLALARPAFSPDGRHVGFTARFDLAPEDGDGARDVCIRKAPAGAPIPGALTLVSAAADGAPGNAQRFFSGCRAVSTGT